jgi:hypothetical protein
MPEIRDGEAFSITIGEGARPCIVFPPALFDPGSCPKDSKAIAEAPQINPDSRVLALGSVAPDDHGKAAIATVVATATHLADNTEPGDVREFARGMADGLVKSRPGAKVKVGPSVRMVTIDGVHAARVTFDASGFSGQGLDHIVSYAAWSRTCDYSLTFMTAPAHAAAIDALADQTASSLHLAEPAPPAEFRMGYAGGQGLGLSIGVALIVLLPAFAFLARSRSRRLRARAPGAAQS